MKLDLEDHNIVQCDMTVDQVRELTTGNDELDTALDNAQGMVFSGDSEVSYLIIKITK